MYANMDQGGKSASRPSPPSSSSSFLNIAAFDDMAYPNTGDLYPEYFDDHIGPASTHAFSGMPITQEQYFVEQDTDDSQVVTQQVYQHHLQEQYHSTEPSGINTPAIEVDFEDLYDNLHISANDKTPRRLSSSIHTRRRAQNRASQRAFRERKEQHVKEVEAKLAELEAKYGNLEDKYKSTKQELERLKAAIGELPVGGERNPGGVTDQFETFLEDVFSFDGNDAGPGYGSR